jgi:hypothetical protein
MTVKLRKSRVAECFNLTPGSFSLQIVGAYGQAVEHTDAGDAVSASTSDLNVFQILGQRIDLGSDLAIRSPLCP